MSESSLKEKLAALKEAKDSPEVQETEVVDLAADVVEEALLPNDFLPSTALEEPQLGIVDPGKELFHVFYNTIPSCRTMTPSGRVINFVGYKFITNVPEEIDFLETEIALGNTFIYTKPEDKVVEADDLDPMKKLRKQFFEEFKQEQEALAAKIASGNLDTSESEPQKLTPGSTKDTADLASGSDSAA